MYEDNLVEDYCESLESTIKEIHRKDLLIRQYKETGMLRLDLLPTHNVQEQWTLWSWRNQ